jgi:thiosulfate/3-mercaptopyruvate sulfurtransferase
MSLPSEENRVDAHLVESDWLDEHLSDPDLRIVDMRGVIKPPDLPKPWYLGQRDAYTKSHIPGAVFVDWTQDLVEPDAPIHMTLAGPTRFSTLMERLGIGDRNRVVVYDDSGGLAPRLWWALNYYGHPHVSVLNGGWTKWLAEARRVTAEPPRYPPAVFTSRVTPEWRVGSAEVRRGLQDSTTTLVDCRTTKEYAGEISRGERRGRIPGAVNLPIGRLLAGDHKTWKRPEEIRELFAAAGLTPDRRIVTYCNAGVSASVGLLGLKLAGYPRAANFAGSWYEWEADPTNPVVTGE